MKRINLMEVNRGVVRHVISILFITCLTLNCFPVVQAGGFEKERGEKATLPPNLILSRHAKPLVEKVWRHSPTFRLQCERIAQAQWLRVKLIFAPKTSAPGKYRALTVINKRSGLARVEIYTPNDYVELIGHEFEHVLEQIEGLDLASLAEEKGGQTFRHADGAFETARALRAGCQVKAEYRRARSLDDLAVAPVPRGLR
jgi:hypothetical protein